MPTQSSDATLRALSVSAGSISPAFSSTTYAYTVSVASGVATTTVTPTVNHSAATVTVNGTTVASGSPSGSIPLNVGANTITVRVTAENGAATQDYTVTVTRQSANADLSALSVGAATSAEATYSTQTLTPSPFAAGTTAYRATVGNAMTHAKVTPTVDYSAATVTVNGTMVASGSPSGRHRPERGRQRDHRAGHGGGHVDHQGLHRHHHAAIARRRGRHSSRAVRPDGHAVPPLPLRDLDRAGGDGGPATTCTTPP